MADHPALILHVLPTFDVGGQQIRTVEVINHLGRIYRHAVVSLDGGMGCRTRLRPDVEVEFPKVYPLPRGLIPRLGAIRARLRGLGPSVLATYNWGAIEWALAKGIRPPYRHVHLEDGFGPEESERQLPRRVLLRRVALLGTSRLVVPSRTLVEVGRKRWNLSPEKILHIPNGVDCARFEAAASRYQSEAADEAPEEIVIGTVAPLRPEKNLDLLLELFAELRGRFPCRLRIVGDGPERGRLVQRAGRLGVADMVEFLGHVEDVERVLPAMDVFVLTSKTEQMPISLLQAMAAGRAVVATEVGDVKAMLAPENRGLVAPRGDGATLVWHLARLLDDPGLRARLGACNRDHVRAHYGLQPMIQAYRQLFEELLGPP